jgi:CBS domain-containing protein
MLIRDILQLKGTQIFSIAPDGRVTDAVREMAARDIGSLVVMDGGRMVGMLTFREVLKALDAAGGNLGDTRVAAVMVREPVRGSPGDTLEQLREVMTLNHVRYLPVEEAGRLVGVISFHDVAKAVMKAADFENRLLRRYIESTPDAGEPRQP